VTADGTAGETRAEEADNVTDESVDEVTTNDDATADSETESESQSRGGVLGRSAKATWPRLAAILLAVALVASAGVAAWLYFKQYRPDQEMNAAASVVALDAAKNGTTSLLSYSPEKLDKDFANAKSHLTGDFLSYYTQFTEQVVTPAAKQKSVKTSASVVRAAVSEMRPDSAVVLVFVNQVTTSKENPEGAFAASAVKVGLKKISDAWLISSFDPV
jgi:Mce-associated membrane protein